MQLVGRAGIGRHLVAHAVDGVGVEPADGAEVDRQAPPQGHGVGAPVLQLGVVEEGVRLGGEDLVAERRRLGGVAEVHLHPAGLDAVEQLGEPVDVEGLGHRVVHGLAHDRVVGDLDRPGGVLLAGGGLGEQRRHHVVGLHALDGRRVPPAALEPQHDERAVEVPPPPALEHGRGRGQHRLLEDAPDGVGVEEAGHIRQREAVVRAERQHHGVVVRRRLQLEVERHAEPLAQGQAQRPVDPAAVGRVHDEVHALGVVEEPLEHEVLVGGHDAQHGPACGHVVDDLVDRGVAERGGRSPARPGRRRRRRRRGSRRAWPAARTPRATALPCGPAPRRSRTGWWAACRRRRPPAPHRRPPGGSATSGCRAGRCRRASTRPPSPR